MLSQENDEASVEEELMEDLRASSICSTKVNDNVQASLFSDITENSKVPNGDFHPSMEPCCSSSNATSKIVEPASTSVTAIKTSVIFSSHLLNRNVPPKDSVQSSVLLRSSYDSHEQDTVANVNLKRAPCSFLNLESSNDEPERKILKTTCLDTAGPSRNASYSYCYDPNTFGCAINNIKILREPTVIKTNAKKVTHISTEINSSITSSQRNTKDITQDHEDSCISEDAVNSFCSPANSLVLKIRVDGVINYISSRKVQNSDNLKSKIRLVFQDSDDDDDETYSSNLFDNSSKCHEDNVKENYFDLLPFDLTEQILCKLPFSDLMRSCSVCKSWNGIISNPTFLGWKKAYYFLKRGYNALPRWKAALPYFDKNVVSVKNCFSALIRFMAKDFLRKPPNGLETFLRQIPSCVTAENLLLERFSEQQSLYTHPWCILTVTVLLSSTVEDLYQVFNYLINVCMCNYEDMLEAMFCIATTLLHCMRVFTINHGLHYRLYNVIYLLENGFSAETTVLPITNSVLQENGYLREQIEEPERKMTYEQIRILNHKLAPNQRVKIISHAGAGKTATLVQFARKHSNLKFLYISLREVLYEDMLQFPPNVVCKSAYSVAYEAVGKRYSAKLVTKLRPFDILPFVHRWKIFLHCLFCYGKCILLTIENFIRSADERLSKAHVPKCSCSPALQVKLKLYNQSDPYDNGELLRLLLLNECMELWEKMVSMDKNVKITPDIYLKLFQLTHPTFPDYDCIMVDETEDCNAAMLDVILSQNMPVILTGDPNQQINELRGTTSPWLSVDATHIYYLTKSFRFGPEIAYVGSCCLEVFGHNTPTLVGSLKPSNIDGIIKGQYAIITRTNETLFLEAMRLCCTKRRKPHEPIHFRGAFVGGMSMYGFEQMADIYRLKAEGSTCGIKDPFIKKFYSFEMLSQYAIFSEDRNIVARLNLVEEYGARIIEYVLVIKNTCSYELGEADVIFSTAQNAKGLEFHTVGLTNDYQVGSAVEHFRYRREYFEFLHIAPTEGHSMESEEQNLIYVAATRAKNCLVMSEKLYSVTLAAQEKFEYPIVSATILDKTMSLKCALCLKNFIPHTLLTMVRQPLIMKSGRKPLSGPLCTSCATNPRYAGVPLLRVETDHAHASMANFVGPLPIEEPIEHDAPSHLFS